MSSKRTRTFTVDFTRTIQYSFSGTVRVKAKDAEDAQDKARALANERNQMFGKVDWRLKGDAQIDEELDNIEIGDADEGK